MIELKKSKVVFDAVEHTYKLGDKYLKGITGLIKRQLFPDEYKDVPDYVLANAAERGHKIHELCHLYDDCGVLSNEIEVINYSELVKELEYEASEYVVSDNEHFASCVDKVFRSGEDTFDLADIKTTYSLNREYVRWQLSIYAYFFELQNPEAKVGKLFAIWLRGNTAKIVEVDRIDVEEVKKLLHCEVNDLPYTGKVIPNNLPDYYKQIEDKMRYIVEQAKYWEAKKKALVDGLRKEMIASGMYQWSGDVVTINRGTDTVRKKFDTAKFKKDHPDLYEKYMIDYTISGVLTIKTI